MKKYAPHPIHGLFRFVERIPGSPWLFYFLVLIMLGLVIHPLLWNFEVVPDGQIDIVYLLSFSWLVETLALGHFGTIASGKALDGYRDQLPVSDAEYQDLRYSFTTIPFIRGTVFFALGFMLGLSTASSIIENISPRPAIINSIAYIQWGVSLGFGLMFVYFIIQQFGQLNMIFGLTNKKQIMNLPPIYAFSRYMAVIAIGLFVIADLNQFILSPENFQSPAAVAQSYIFLVICLIVFYYPLRGINQRLSKEKESLLTEINSRIESMFARIHQAHDDGNFSEVSDLRNMLGALNDEKQVVESIPTWPWKAGTFATLISALALPTIISLFQRLFERILNL